MLDVLVACLLISSCVVYAVYMTRYAAAYDVRAHYHVYDDMARARARWLMPLKVQPEDLPVAELSEVQVGMQRMCITLLTLH